MFSFLAFRGSRGSDPSPPESLPQLALIRGYTRLAELQALLVTSPTLVGAMRLFNHFTTQIVACHFHLHREDRVSINSNSKEEINLDPCVVSMQIQIPVCHVRLAVAVLDDVELTVSPIRRTTAKAAARNE